MNYIKLQQDLLKDFLKEKVKRCLFFEENESVFISPDGLVIYRIPKCCFLLDSYWIKKNFPSNMNLKQFYNEDECTPAFLTRAYILRDDRTLMEVENEDFTAYFDKDLLKYFKNPTFKIKSSISVAGVYEDGEFVGVICPCRVKK